MPAWDATDATSIAASCKTKCNKLNTASVASDLCVCNSDKVGTICEVNCAWANFKPAITTGAAA